MSCVNDAITLIMKIIFSFIELFFNNGESKKDFWHMDGMAECAAHTSDEAHQFRRSHADT